MTHLSDFSYLDRLVFNLLVFPLVLYHVLVVKKGLSDIFSKKKDGKRMRFLVFAFYFFAYVFGISYDALATQLKYREGFVDTCLIDTSNNATKVFRYPKAAFDHAKMNPASAFQYLGPDFINASFTNEGNCGIKQTPSSLFSEEHLDVLPIIDILWNLQCTCRNSGIFMMLAWFNFTVKSFFQEPCLKRWECLIFEFYSFFSLVSYFILPMIVMSPLLSTISSQLLWSIELYLACFFLVVANYRMDHMVRARTKTESRNGSTNGGWSRTAEALYYIKTINLLLAFVAAMEATGLFAINVDIIMVEWRVIYGSKLLTDIYTKIFNLFFVIEPIIVVIILYKPRFLHIRDSTQRSTVVAPVSHAESSKVATSGAFESEADESSFKPKFQTVSGKGIKV